MISFVIPARNERGNVRELVAEIVKVVVAMKREYEVILVDDGSTDGTWEEILGQAAASERVHGLRLRRSFGKGPALSAGFEQAKGDVIFCMDADLQDDPVNIPMFLAKVAAGYDVVSGWRRSRQDSFSKRLQSKLFNVTVSKMTGLWLHDHNCGFKCFRRETLTGLQIYGDMHRFLPILMHMRGFLAGEVVVSHRQRARGTSKYGKGWGRTYRGFFDLMTVLFLKRFKYSPMHLLGLVGAMFILLGVVGLAYLGVLWLDSRAVGFRPLMIYAAVSLIFGGQLVATGMLAELITSYLVRTERLFLVRETTVDAMLLDQPGVRTVGVKEGVIPRSEPRVPLGH